MFKKFLNGIVFGAGFGLALIVVVVVFFMFFFQPLVERKFTSSHSEARTSSVVSAPPAIHEEHKYLGSPAIYSGDFMSRKSSVLSEGPGEIVGKALVNKKPVTGLKLRLALNGSVMSQWATTDANGQYVIRVPYGKYRIDGYELDTDSANTVLAGKIDHPECAHSSSVFEVQKDGSGLGLTFDFVDPIQKILTKNKFSLSENVVLHWTPYPGASRYTIQIYEKSEPYAFVGNNKLFEWSKQPSTSDTSYDLKKHGVKLKPGHFYAVEIQAQDSRMAVVSQTVRTYSGYDFEVVQ